MSGPDRRDAVLLLSGGLDSATTLALARESGFRVHALTVDYGQRHAVEVERAALLADQLGASSHRIVRLDLTYLRGNALTDLTTPIPRDRDPDAMGDDIPSTYVPARNTLFLSLALGWAETLDALDLFIGANAVDYSGYPDCRPEFLEAFESLANTATRAGVEGRRIRVHAPLLRLSKKRIVEEAVRLGVDYRQTVSCYGPNPDGTPCGGCDACRLRSRGFSEAGVEDGPAEG